MPIPAPFQPISRISPLIEMIGPVYSHGSGTDLVIGMRAQEKHCNLRGHVHGGIFATLADIALGYTLAFSSDPPAGYVTVNLSIDYAGTANVGDWMEVRTDVQRRGKRLAFANAYIHVGEQRIARASGVFMASDWPSASKHSG